MESKQIEVRCPCCDTRLTVDVRTRTVLKHARPEQVDEAGRTVLDPERWGAAQVRARDRVGDAEEALGEALEDERAKERRLDDLFDRENRKLRGDDEG